MTLVWIIFINLAISLISFVGVTTFVSKKLLSKKLTCVFISFSAGVLLSAAFINMLSEAIHTGGEEVLTYTLFGVVFSFLMERSVLWYHHHHDNTHNIKPTGSLVLFGDGIHNFIDGVAIAATVMISPVAGISAAIGIAAHEIPQEFADFMILVHSGYEKKRALFLNFLSALTAVAGGIVGYFFVNRIEGALPIALAMTAGIFIYIAAADLIPELHEDHHKQSSFTQIVPFILGIFLILAISSFP